MSMIPPWPSLSSPRDRCFGRVALRLAVGACLFFSPLIAVDQTSYSYGDCWWEEPVSGKGTELLLHFGSPAPRAPRQLALVEQALAAAPDPEAALLDDDLDDEALIEMIPTPTSGERRKPPVDERHRRADEILDYGEQRLRVPISTGTELVGEGYFGAGLALHGGGGLNVRLGELTRDGQWLEGWFHVESLPPAPACLLSYDDEARILLHPDGRLELVLAKPHGVPGNATTAEERAAIMQRTVDLVGRTRVVAGRWFHVRAWCYVPMAQGPRTWQARLVLDGDEIARYNSESGNSYAFLPKGRGRRVVIGNSLDGSQPFTGRTDAVRLVTSTGTNVARTPMPWREEAATRPVVFNRPYFLADSAVVYADGSGPDLQRGNGAITLHGAKTPWSGLATPGIRGDGLLTDRTLGLARVPLGGMTTGEGSLEAWLRPVNWDNTTGYFQRPKGKINLTVLRLMANHKGKTIPFITMTLPRMHDLMRKRERVDPGHWGHWVITWQPDHQRARIFLDGRYWGWTPVAALPPETTLAYAEFGTPDTDIAVKHGEVPRLAFDEVVGYRTALVSPEVTQAFRRWQVAAQPLDLVQADLEYRYSTAHLIASAEPLLPEGVASASVRFQLQHADGRVAYGPYTVPVTERKTAIDLNKPGEPVPYGDYRMLAELLVDDGRILATNERSWQFKPDPWRGNRIGVLDKTPEPWTPIAVEGRELRTRMSTWVVGADGLPAQIIADGVDLLAAPMQLLEDGKPLAGTLGAIAPSRDVAGGWTTRMKGANGAIDITFDLEFDGCLRTTLRPAAGSTFGRLEWRIPFHAARASHALWTTCFDQNTSTTRLPDTEGALFAARTPALRTAERQATRRKQPAPDPATFASWNFLTQLSVHDRDRGLYWFADNARGWGLAQDVDAQHLVRTGDQIVLTLTLAATPGSLTGDPLIFGMIPHPARPLPTDHRRFQRATAEQAPRNHDIFDCFREWSMDPRQGSLSMQLFPAADPQTPDDRTPSWDYAERCIPYMRADKPSGRRTLYLSRYWFSCRAGTYDGWEWRGGPSGQCTLVPSLIDYTCWEIDQWIGRGIYDAIYLDECYNVPTRLFEAGLAVTLPDGSILPGDTLWGFREMMKRWRGIFHQHGVDPILISHHTGSWPYAGTVFCDAALDGENRPIVTATSGDFVDQVGLQRAESIQNGRLWGVAPHYMVCVWEGGFEKKDVNPHKRWSWRMMRTVMSLLAHFEVGHAYSGQGQQVIKSYWNDVLAWGAGDASVPFVPYWQAAPAVTVEGPDDQSLVSYYRKDGAILLVASNRSKEASTLRIRIDRAALGLPATMRFHNRDSSFAPAEGRDLQRPPPRNAAPRPGDILRANDEPDEIDREIAAIEREVDLEPRLEGDVLILPIRPRDFRLIALE